MATPRSQILSLIKKQQAMYFNDILEETNVGHNTLVSILKQLQDDGYINADSQFHGENRTRSVRYFATDKLRTDPNF